MFFILSKVFLGLLFPFFWIVILFIWSWHSKKPIVKKRLRALIILIFLLFSNQFFFRSMVTIWQPTPTKIPVHLTYHAGILLGGLAGFDKNKRGYFGNSADRFIQAANLYHQGIIQKIIVSGGTGSLDQDEPAEAPFLQSQLIENGVKEEDIIVESRSRNTYENAVFTKQIIDSLQFQPPFILITSALHMRRSVSVFKKAGVNNIPFPCDYKVVPKNLLNADLIIPDISLLKEWGLFIKEVVGLYVYKLTGKA